jgi:hypothetical protein
LPKMFITPEVPLLKALKLDEPAKMPLPPSVSAVRPDTLSVPLPLLIRVNGLLSI